MSQVCAGKLGASLSSTSRKYQTWLKMLGWDKRSSLSQYRSNETGYCQSQLIEGSTEKLSHINNKNDAIM